MTQEILDFLCFYGYKETCSKCGKTVYTMIDKKVQPHILNADLSPHSHDESKPVKVKQLIEQERRSPGGAW
jgi:hypothetical protein